MDYTQEVNTMEINKIGRIAIFLAIMLLICLIYVGSVNREESKLSREMRDTEIKGYEEGWNNHSKIVYTILTNLKNGNVTITTIDRHIGDNDIVISENMTTKIVAMESNGSYTLCLVTNRTNVEWELLDR